MLAKSCDTIYRHCDHSEFRLYGSNRQRPMFRDQHHIKWIIFGIKMSILFQWYHEIINGEQISISWHMILGIVYTISVVNNMLIAQQDWNIFTI